jgi:hypothetical protein
MIKIEISLDQINYGEIADTVIPFVIDKISSREDAGKFIQLLDGLDELPGSLAKTALDVLPEKLKEEMTVYFIDKYKEGIREVINNLAKENKIMAEVSKIRVCRESRQN